MCCDSDGRLNSKSIVLQGNQDVVRGRTLPLDPSQVPSYSLFPGQVVGVKATNPTGSRLVATEVYSDASIPKEDVKKKKLRQELQIVVAAGPYTTSGMISNTFLSVPFFDWLELYQYLFKTKEKLEIILAFHQTISNTSRCKTCWRMYRKITHTSWCSVGPLLTSNTPSWKVVRRHSTACLERSWNRLQRQLLTGIFIYSCWKYVICLPTK